MLGRCVIRGFCGCSVPVPALPCPATRSCEAVTAWPRNMLAQSRVDSVVSRTRRIQHAWRTGARAGQFCVLCAVCTVAPRATVAVNMVAGHRAMVSRANSPRSGFGKSGSKTAMECPRLLVRSGGPRLGPPEVHSEPAPRVARSLLLACAPLSGLPASKPTSGLASLAYSLLPHPPASCVMGNPLINRALHAPASPERAHDPGSLMPLDCNQRRPAPVVSLLLSHLGFLAASSPRESLLGHHH